MAQDILITPGSGEPQILFRGSGTTDTAVELNVLSSYQSGTGSGTAILFEGTEGQLFGITDNLSSGTIFSVADITGLPIIEADASGDVKLGEYGRYVGIGTGVPAYGLDVFSSGILRKGVILSNYVPATTTNALYNEGGTLKFNGSSIGGVDTYTSGVATYASGQAISNQGNITALLTASGTATSLIASSGIASYASGQAVSNQSNISALLTASGIATSLLAVSGTATSLVATSGIAAYASGQVSPALSVGSGINIDAANRINVYGGTSNFENIQLTTNNTVVPKMVFTGSGVNNPPITLRVESGFQSATGSGTALLFEGEEGVLFSITDNLSSGVIFNVTNDLGLPLVEVEAHGDVKIGENASGIILYKPTLISNSVPSDTANKLYNDAGTLKFNGAATYAPLLTASGAAIYASGQVNVSTAGTATASKALVLDAAKSFTGTKHGVFNEFDSRVTASGVTIGASGITLAGGAYVQEAVPANDTPATEDATITLDLNTGNYHNVVLGVDVTKFEFINAKRGQRFLLRITQHASSAKTIAWTNVDYTTGGAAATVRWAGGGTAPTMSTSTSHTDVYGFLCTNNAGSAFDGFVVGQNLPD